MKILGSKEKASGRLDRFTRILGIITSALLGICLIGASKCVEANVTATFGAGFPPSPLTFSGTYCGLGGYTSTNTPNSYMTRAELWIGGVKGKEVTNTDPSVTSLSINMIWDSTHFTHNQTVELKVVGYNNLGESGRTYRPIQDKIYNRYAAFIRNEFEILVPTFNSITGYIEQMNYYRGYASQQGWTTTNVLNSIRTDSLFYFATHGSSLAIQDDYILTITRSQIADAVTQRIAPAGADINLVFNNACESLYDQDWPLSFGIPASSTDRAYVGWVDVSETLAAQRAALDGFWPAMRNGLTASEAKFNAQLVYNIYKQFFDATIDVYGDPATKSHGVYGGTSGLPDVWWR